MAAEALEQSMLESKDKEQLLAIAQALGIKTTCARREGDADRQDPRDHERRRGPSADAAAPATNGRATRATKDAGTRPRRRPTGRAADSFRAKTSADARRDEQDHVGSRSRSQRSSSVPDGEPLADWEIALIKSGEVAVTDLAVSPSGSAPTVRRAGTGQGGDGDDGDAERRRQREPQQPKPPASAQQGPWRRAATAPTKSGSTVPTARNRPPDETVADRHGAGQRGRLPRPARRGLRLPPRQRLPGQPRRRVHPGEADPPVRLAQGRPRHRPQPARRSQREEPGAARDPHRQRRRPRDGQDPAAVRGPHRRCSPTRSCASRTPATPTT